MEDIDMVLHLFNILKFIMFLVKFNRKAVYFIFFKFFNEYFMLDLLIITNYKKKLNLKNQTTGFFNFNWLIFEFGILHFMNRGMKINQTAFSA